MAEKSKQAYRNIRETSEILELKPHVLRFWETKFESLQPMTRGGGRRFYSPSDIDILKTIKELLYERGLTIKAASKIVDAYGTNAIHLAPESVHLSREQPSGQSNANERNQILRIRKLEEQLRTLESNAIAHISYLESMARKISAAMI